MDSDSGGFLPIKQLPFSLKVIDFFISPAYNLPIVRFGCVTSITKE